MAPPGRVHLTFDDGPNPTWTPRVAAELERLGTRGTFFVVGRHVARNPDVVRALVEAGHEIGLHCMRHDAHEEERREAVEADTGEALAVLEEIGVRPRWWRPPGGRLASWTRAVAHGHGLRLAGWSSDPRDWDGCLAGTMLERMAPDLGAGSVVVLHDGGVPTGMRTDCSQTVELIEPLVANIRARGWEPAPLGDGAGAWLRWDRPLNGAVRARRRLRMDSAAGRPIDVAVVDEDDLTEEDLAGLSALLAASMTRLGPEYAERPWRRLRPSFRAVARSEGSVVGQLSAFLIGTRPARRVFGLGDLAVARGSRGRGVATELAASIEAECRRRGAEIVLRDTVALRPRCLRAGYAPVPRFRFFYERDGACHWHPNWLARIHHPEHGARLELAEGDF